MAMIRKKPDKTLMPPRFALSNWDASDYSVAAYQEGVSAGCCVAPLAQETEVERLSDQTSSEPGQPACKSQESKPRGLSSERCQPIRILVMVWFALVSGTLLVALSAYGIVSGDGELLLKTCSILGAAFVASVAWAGGSEVLEALQRIRLGPPPQ
jgi:hypothetical protein